MERVTIIGLGLIGGSLALALKKAKAGRVEITGFSRRPETLAKAGKIGAVDKPARSMASAVAGADIVIIATPVMTIKDVLASISKHLSPGCVVTDVGSTKVKVMRWAEKYLPPEVSFIGGHPMAGKETFGIAEADASLFRTCPYCLIPASGATTRSVKKMKELAESVGARPLFIDAELHDSLVAGVSHLPMVLSAAFVTATTKSESWPKMSKLAAGGYRDFSRLASGSSEMNRDICLTNREEIVDWMDRYIEVLKKYRSLMAEDSERLYEMLTRARDAREKWLRGRKL